MCTVGHGCYLLGPVANLNWLLTLKRQLSSRRKRNGPRFERLEVYVKFRPFGEREVRSPEESHCWSLSCLTSEVEFLTSVSQGHWEDEVRWSKMDLCAILLFSASKMLTTNISKHSSICTYLYVCHISFHKRFETFFKPQAKPNKCKESTRINKKNACKVMNHKYDLKMKTWE